MPRKKNKNTAEKFSELFDDFSFRSRKGMNNFFDDIAKNFVDRMYGINGKIWETEGDIRKCVDMPLEEVGRLAIRVRELNQVRNGIKGEIVDEFAEGFKEIKVNYKKVDYGRSD